MKKTIIGLFMALACLTVQAEEIRVVVLVEDQEGGIQRLVAEVVSWLPDTVELCNLYVDEWYRENMIVSLLHRSTAEGEVITVGCVDWSPVTRIFKQLRQADD